MFLNFGRLLVGCDPLGVLARTCRRKNRFESAGHGSIPKLTKYGMPPSAAHPPTRVQVVASNKATPQCQIFFHFADRLDVCKSSKN